MLVYGATAGHFTRLCSLSVMVAGFSRRVGRGPSPSNAVMVRRDAARINGKPIRKIADGGRPMTAAAPGTIDRDAVRERVGAYLRAKYGAGGGGNRWEAIDKLEVEERRFLGWLYAETAPDAEGLARLLAHEGAGFFNAVFAPLTGLVARPAGLDQAAEVAAGAIEEAQALVAHLRALADYGGRASALLDRIEQGELPLANGRVGR